MYPHQSGGQQNSIFEYVDNDLFANMLMDQPYEINNASTFQRINSNPNFMNPMQYSLIDNFEQPEMKLEEQQIKKQKPRKKTHRMNVKDESGILQQNNDLFSYKNNLKNTYINKITSLISQDQVKQKVIQSKRFKPQYEDEINDQREDGEDNTHAKLLRNRECARNSRKRKKIYIELLENRVKALSEDLEKTKRILKTSDSYFSKMSQNQQLQGFFLGRQQLYEKLDKAVQNNADVNEINLLLDSMRFRVGGGGKERVNASNYFFTQILEICFPTHVRYMLMSAANNKDMYADNEEDVVSNTWTFDLQNQLQITEQQRKQIKKSQRRIIADKNKLEELLTQFHDIKEQLYAKTSQLENFIDELRNILTPMQAAKFLIGLEKVFILIFKNSYRKEMNISKLWDILDGPSDQDMDVKEEDSEQQQNKKVHL